MKIIDNALRDHTFDELDVGATFKQREEYFIKIEEVTYGLHPWNAIQLNTGELNYFTDNAEVIPFNCELIVL